MTKVLSWPYLGGTAAGVAVSGGHAYVAWVAQSPLDRQDNYNENWHEQGLRIFDLARPATPRSVGALKTGPFAIDVWAAGDRAYLSVFVHGVRVLDTREANNPRHITNLAPLAADLAVTSDRIYLASRTGGLFVAEHSGRADAPSDDRSEAPSTKSTPRK